jgi:hypothetical protein
MPAKRTHLPHSAANPAAPSGTDLSDVQEPLQEHDNPPAEHHLEPAPAHLHDSWVDEAEVDMHMDHDGDEHERLSGSPQVGHQDAGVQADTLVSGMRTGQVQAVLVGVPAGEGLTIAIAKPLPTLEEADEPMGEGQPAPQESTLPNQDSDAPCSNHMHAHHSIHDLLWPGQNIAGVHLPSEHVVRPAPSLAELAEADDGKLQTEINLEDCSLDDFLAGASAAGEDAEAQVCAGPRTDPETSIFVSDSEEDEDTHVPDNLEGHLVGVISRQGAEPFSGFEGQGEDEGVEADAAGDEPIDPMLLQAKPLDVETLKHLMQVMRQRGGQFDADPLDEEGGDEQEHDGGDHEWAAEGGAEVEKHLCEPVWKLEQPGECRLKLLQAVQLIAEYKERHRVTLPAMADLLTLLQALLPGNSLPKSVYTYRKAQRSVLKAALGGPGFQRIHLCSDLNCTHLYDNDARLCPECDKPRFKRLENGKEAPIRDLRYMSLDKAVRVLLMSRKVSRAIDAFDLEAMVDSTYSVYSSKLSQHLCEYFIPGYRSMCRTAPTKAREAKLRFFETGQVCTDTEWQQYNLEVEAGTRRPTKLLMLEGGCDGFQPFKRRVWSTWLFGYRLTCVNWYHGESSQFEIVTAISSGASEGKAAQVVAALDAQQLVQLSPPSAQERTLGQTGAVLVPNPPCMHRLSATSNCVWEQSQYHVRRLCVHHSMLVCCRDTSAGGAGRHAHVDEAERGGRTHVRGRVGHMLRNTGGWAHAAGSEP